MATENYVDNYTFYASYYRGLLISNFASLEKAIEFFIADYFVSDKNRAMELQHIVLDRMTFESKRTAFRAILEKKEIQEGFKKTKKNSYSCSKLVEEIRRLNEIRNQFAHWFPVLPSSDNGSVIALAEYRDNIAVKYYTLKEMDEITQRIFSARDAIFALPKH